METCFEGFEKREVRIKLIALQAVWAVVRVYDQKHLIGSWRHAVVVFIPEHNNGVGLRSMREIRELP